MPGARTWLRFVPRVLAPCWRPAPLSMSQPDCHGTAAGILRRPTCVRFPIVAGRRLALLRTRIGKRYCRRVGMFLVHIAEVKLKVVARSSPTHPRSAAFASAVERGAAWAQEEYARPDNLSIEQVASYVGLPIETVFERFTTGLYYALAPDSEHSALKFPKWQFDAEHWRVLDLFRILREASVGAWTIQSFMVSPNCLLQDRTPREWILNPQADMNVLLQMARSRFASDQGAG